MSNPSTYLSTGDNGHTWTVIHQGMPLCAGTTLERAKSVAEQYGFEPGDIAWNGERSEWVHVSTIADVQS